MPHVSQKKLDKKTVLKLEERLMLLLSQPGIETRQEIFRELFTETEQLMFAKRLTILFLLSEGESPYAVTNHLGVSSSTVDRFKLAIEQKRFTRTTRWLKRSKGVHKTLSIIAELVSIPYEAQRKSLYRALERKL